MFEIGIYCYIEMETLRALITILLKNKRTLFQEQMGNNSNSVRNYNRRKKRKGIYLYT